MTKLSKIIDLQGYFESIDIIRTKVRKLKGRINKGVGYGSDGSEWAISWDKDENDYEWEDLLKKGSGIKFFI